MSAVLETLRKQQEDREEQLLKELYDIIQKYLEAHPDNEPTFPLTDLEEKLRYVHALNEIERLERIRAKRKLAEAAAVLAKNEEEKNLEQSDIQDSEEDSSENDYTFSETETDNSANESSDSLPDNITAIYSEKICDPPVEKINMNIA